MNHSLKKKRLARLAAIQALYHRFVMDSPRSAQQLTDDMLLQFGAVQNEDWNPETTPDKPLLLALLSGVLEEFEALGGHITPILREDWKEERISPIIRAILYLAAYEFAFRAQSKSPVINDEYTLLAAEFFDNPELGFVHSALKRLEAALRPA